MLLKHFVQYRLPLTYALSGLVILHRLTFVHFCLYTCKQVMEVEGRLWAVEIVEGENFHAGEKKLSVWPQLTLLCALCLTDYPCPFIFRLWY